MSTVSPAATDTCTVKVLPKELWASAAQKAIEINPANALPVQSFAMALPEAAPQPEHLALLTGKRWPATGVTLTVGFLDNPAADLKARLLSHMNAWSQFANVHFVETSSNPQVRIARTAGGGYWSYLGTDILSIPANQPTMNLDSFTMNTPESEYHRVVRHETGHTLAFPHEHTRSDIVNRIDREKAIAYFMATQGWSRNQVIAQVLTPLDNSALIATSQADPNSIMCYWLPASIMRDGVAISGGTDIDAMDAQFAGQVYPLSPAQSSKAAPSLAPFLNRLRVSFVANNSTNQLLVCSSADGALWTNNTLVHGERSKTAPSMAVFNGRAWIAFVANNSTNQVLISSSADGQNWTANTLVHGESSKTAPSIAAFNNKLYTAFIANNNTNQVLICSSTDGQNWSGNSLVHGGESSKTAPSLAVFNGRLYVAFVANNNTNQLLICSTSDGQNWTGNSLVHGGESSKAAPSLGVFNGRLYVAFIANNSTNQVLVCSTADGHTWTGNSLVHGESSKDAPSLAAFNNRLYVSFLANNSTNQVLLCSTADGVTWTGNIVI